MWFEARECVMTEAPKTILCIEDDRETSTILAEELADRGFLVEVALTARRG